MNTETCVYGKGIASVRTGSVSTIGFPLSYAKVLLIRSMKQDTVCARECQHLPILPRVVLKNLLGSLTSDLNVGIGLME